MTYRYEPTMVEVCGHVPTAIVAVTVLVAVFTTETLLEPKLFTYRYDPTRVEKYGFAPTVIVVARVLVTVLMTETLPEP